MRFPAGLRAQLLRRDILRVLGGETAPTIFHLSPLVRHFPAGFQPDNASPETAWHSHEACVQATKRARASIVWLGGTEPFFHPAIGEVASALAKSGRYVFLHTGGAGLRKRIHEFAPVDQLYLTFEIPTHHPVGAHSMDSASRTAPFYTVVEAIRTARLSGFHVCAHFTGNESTSVADIAARVYALQSQHLDGIIVSSGGVLATQSEVSRSKALATGISLVPSRGWRSFSRLLEHSYAQLRDRIPLPQGTARQRSGASACGETA